MHRDAFLAHVRQAARQGQAYRVPRVEATGDPLRFSAAGDALVATMAREAEAVGGLVHVAADHAAARREIDRLLGHYQARQALCWNHPVLERVGLVQLLAERSVSFYDDHRLLALDAAECRSRALGCDIGFTSADRAIAESGSLLLIARGGQPRSASLLPPVHVAVIERAQIVADLFDAFESLECLTAAGMPANIVFITGPSKTGDIELELTTGVHGPGAWHVVIVDGDGEELMTEKLMTEE